MLSSEFSFYRLALNSVILIYQKLQVNSVISWVVIININPHFCENHAVDKYCMVLLTNRAQWPQEVIKALQVNEQEQDGVSF